MFSNLLATSILAFGLSVAAQDTSTNAPVVTSSQTGVEYQAILLHKDNTTVQGVITIGPITPLNDINAIDSKPAGVFVSVLISGVPENTALSYHIHANPVPEDGNCYETGGHLDPYNRGDTTPCDIKAPNTCQVGDLSGKHGPAYAPPNNDFDVDYIDYFLSLDPDNVAYFANLSVVVHAPDKSRLTCGNFHQSYPIAI